MLRDLSASTALATGDMDRARSFYEGVLGFAADEDVAEGVVYSAGSTQFLVYPSTFAGTNKATAMAFRVPDESFEAEITDLRARGVTFDTFDAEGLIWHDGVAHVGEMRMVWFHDPDGNIIAVETG